jgi:hypothetical protein
MDADHLLTMFTLFQWIMTYYCLGHGGHLDHALQWFGGLNGKSVREVCPTGCGHKCNFMQQLSAFPRTGSLRNINDALNKSTELAPQVDKLPAGLFCRPTAPR